MRNRSFWGRDIARDKNYSEEIAAAIDREIKCVMDQSYQRATKILEEHRDLLDMVAKTLIEKETIEGAEFRTLLGEPAQPGEGETTQQA